MLVFAGLVPHPPIVVSEIGKEDAKKVSKTHEAYSKLAENLAKTEPDTVLIISPHMLHYPNLFTVCGMKNIFGNFANFGAEAIKFEGQSDFDLATEIVDEAETEGLPTILYDNGDEKYEIDHGVMVPLYFFQQKNDYPFHVLPVSYSNLTRAEHYTFGQIIAEICQKSDKRIAVIASGDLSHRLIGTHEKIAKEFDQKFLAMIEKKDEHGLMNLDENLLDEVGECGYRSVLILLGILNSQKYAPEIYSYEGPFGVGYGVVNMNLENKNI